MRVKPQWVPRCRTGGDVHPAALRETWEGLMEIIGVIIAGIIIGLLGKFVAPGDKDNIPILMTVLCGIGGVVSGWFIYSAFGGNGSSGIDWTRWVVAIICSAVLVVIASTVMGRNTGHRGVFHH